MPRKSGCTLLLTAALVSLSGPFVGVRSAEGQTVDADEKLARILALDSWDESRFAKFVDGEMLTIDEQLEMARLALRLDGLDPRMFRVDAQGDSPGSVATDSDHYRGKLVHLAGRAVAAQPVPLPAEALDRLGVSRLFTVSLAGDDGQACTLFSPAIPEAWQQLPALDEPIKAGGVFVKMAPAGDESSIPIVVTPRIAWYPSREDSPAVNIGMSVLGNLGYDVAQLDAIEQRQRLTRRDSAAFYSMLSVMGDVGPHQLVRFGQRNLESHAAHWNEERQSLAGANPSTEPNRRDRWKLARAVIDAANDGRYSVAPFFNEPDRHVGQLVMLDGTVSRAVRIDLGGGLGGAADPTASQFDVPFYYEIDLFTADSQNFPIIFCVRQLPKDFPTGEGLNERVRVAGFFFKNWRFNTGRSSGGRESKSLATPLFVSSGFLRLVPAEETIPWGLIGGSTFMLVVAILWIVAWRTNRADRRLERQRREATREKPSFDFAAEGESE